MPDHTDDRSTTKAEDGRAESPAGVVDRRRPYDEHGSNGDPAASAWQPPPWVPPEVEEDAVVAAALDEEAERAAMAERERWFREYLEREQRFRLFVGRYLAGLLGRPPLWMRVWRWLIDDIRSEHRAEAALLTGRPRAGLLAWLRDRRRRRVGR